jgi:hypothetical protein
VVKPGVEESRSRGVEESRSRGVVGGAYHWDPFQYVFAGALIPNCPYGWHRLHFARGSRCVNAEGMVVGAVFHRPGKGFDILICGSGNARASDGEFRSEWAAKAAVVVAAERG